MTLIVKCSHTIFPDFFLRYLKKAQIGRRNCETFLLALYKQNSFTHFNLFFLLSLRVSTEEECFFSPHLM